MPDIIKLSRSTVEKYLSCPRCCVLDKKYQIKPPSLPFTLNIAVDNLCKNEFDYYRKIQEPHPLFIENGIDAVPFKHKDLELWRSNFQGIRYKSIEHNYDFGGAVDDIWQKKNGDLIIVDVKATSRNNFDWSETFNKYEYAKAYKRQLEMYQWLFKKNGFQVNDSFGRDQYFDQILFATGRTPNSKGLQIGSTGLKFGINNEVLVDKYSRSSIGSIYAIGDLTNRKQLTPVAIKEAMAFVETVFHKNPTYLDYNCIPTAIFTKPEMGTVGLSEELAVKRGPVDIFTTYFKPMKTGFAENEDKSFIKLVVCKKTDKVLGVHIVAPGAGEMIQMAAIALSMGATKKDFDNTLPVHPTLSEEIVTMQKPTRSS